MATPPPDAVEDVRPAVPLTSLVGRRDLAFGDPVAVALAPGAESDTLLVAWATLGDDGYRLGLDRYLVADRSAAASGSREILALPFEDARGPTSLADLAVSVSPDGSAALVGVTVARIQPTPGERRLVILRMDAGAVPGDAIGPPEALPSLVTSNAAGPAEVARDHETPCGGGLGEGWATGDAIFLVCPGRPSVFRRVAIHPGSARSFSDREGPPVAAAILDETILMPESGATALWLADNGVVIDRLRGRYYRWSPWARVLWSIDLRAEAGVRRHRAVGGDRVVRIDRDRLAHADGHEAGPATRSSLTMSRPTASTCWRPRPRVGGPGSRSSTGRRWTPAARCRPLASHSRPCP